MFGPLAVAAGIIAYGAVHSLLASVAVKQWTRTRFGPRTDRFYRLAYNAFAVVSFVPVLALLAWLPGTRIYGLPLPWSALAVMGQAGALLLLTAGLMQTDPWSFLGLRQAAEGTPAEPARLIVTGLYRWVRHPLYTAGLLLLWLTPVMTTSILAFNLALTLYILVGSRLEERRLAAEFGPAYAEYQAKVAGLIPRPPRSRVTRQP
jgi:protein-S-isoprenylcysteine O-methyltransferase Ste14